MALPTTLLGSSVPNAVPTFVSAASGALPTGGTVYITYNGGAGAYTLAAPVVDGSSLLIISFTAQAHVVTTPANMVNGADDTLTFGAAALNGCLLRAVGGQWISTAFDRTNVTLTEV